ncbi:MAG: hypothetical protein Q7J07_07780 [Pelolinea sp.]|nr:hypothetical protein [Pelolinea sp.]
MQEKVKINSDRDLIKKIFGVTPIDWARYPDGRIVFISPTGQKFSYTQDRIDQEEQTVDRQISTHKAAMKKPAPNAKEKSDQEPDTAGAAAK